MGANYKGWGKWSPATFNHVREDGFYAVTYDHTPNRGFGPTKQIQTAKEHVRRQLQPGDRVEANYKGRGKWLPAEFLRESRKPGFYTVVYDHGSSNNNYLRQRGWGSPKQAFATKKEHVRRQQGDNDKRKYSGDWSKDKFSGFGTLEYTNGDVYRGGFSNDAPWGSGLMTYADGRIFQSQNVDSDLFYDSLAKLQAGDKVLCHYLTKGVKSVKSKCPGRGTIHRVNGQAISITLDDEAYQGGIEVIQRDWVLRVLLCRVQDSKNTFGNHKHATYKYPDGRFYVGHWLNGFPDGLGKMTYLDGTLKFGQWKENNFIGRCSTGDKCPKHSTYKQSTKACKCGKPWEGESLQEVSPVNKGGIQLSEESNFIGMDQLSEESNFIGMDQLSPVL